MVTVVRTLPVLWVKSYPGKQDFFYPCPRLASTLA